MKMQRFHIQATVIILFTLLCWLAPHPAYALFSGEKAKLLKEADKNFNLTTKYLDENRMLDAISSIQEAMLLYRRLYREYPNYKMQHVASQLKESSARLNNIVSQISSGEVTVPSPDEIASGAGKGFVSEKTGSHTARIEEPPLPGFQPQPGPLIPRPYSQVQVAAPQKTAITVEETPYIPAPYESMEDIDYLRRLKEAENDTARVRIVSAMVESGSATDAVLALEDMLEETPYSNSLSLRLMYIQALMARKNYKHAETEIEKLINQYPKDPAARCLLAAINVTQGRYVGAMFQLDLLAQDFPNYADIYINLAYISFIIDPYENRDDAIAYYKEGILKGARRDPGFETELNLEIKK